MRFDRRLLVVILLTIVLGSPYAAAQPQLSVIRRGATSDGNLKWDINVVPDTTLFSPTAQGSGSALAVELDFRVPDGGKILSINADTNLWPYENPGNNPVAGSITTGVWINASGSEAFVALGSVVRTDGSPVHLLSLTTAGTDPTQLNWGGKTALANTPRAYVTGRISQTGQNFNNYAGSLVTHLGDLNEDRDVDSGDLLAFLENWTGSLSSPDPSINYSSGDWDGDADVDSGDLLIFLSAWTGAAPATGPSVALPEPTTLLSLQACFTAALALWASRRRR